MCSGVRGGARVAGRAGPRRPGSGRLDGAAGRRCHGERRGGAGCGGAARRGHPGRLAHPGDEAGAARRPACSFPVSHATASSPGAGGIRSRTRGRRPGAPLPPRPPGAAGTRAGGAGSSVVVRPEQGVGLVSRGRQPARGAPRRGASGAGAGPCPRGGRCSPAQKGRDPRAARTSSEEGRVPPAPAAHAPGSEADAAPRRGALPSAGGTRSRDPRPPQPKMEGPGPLARPGPG